MRIDQWPRLSKGVPQCAMRSFNTGLDWLFPTHCWEVRWGAEAEWRFLVTGFRKQTFQVLPRRVTLELFSEFTVADCSIPQILGRRRLQICGLYRQHRNEDYSTHQLIDFLP